MKHFASSALSLTGPELVDILLRHPSASGVQHRLREAEEAVTELRRDIVLLSLEAPSSKLWLEERLDLVCHIF